jgi:periplasmic divalent cation tolerance protein
VNFSFIYITTPNKKTAQKISKTLVKERLVACANIGGPIESIYQWKSKLCVEKEISLILKTTALKQKRVISRVKELHPYECPCIVVLPVSSGNPAFLKWLKDETK